MAPPAVHPTRPGWFRPVSWIGLSVGVAGVIGAVTTSPAAAPITVQLGGVLARAGADVAGVTCVGLTLLTVLLPRPSTLPGRALRPLLLVRGRIERALIIVAAGWVGVQLLGIGFRAADAYGEPLTDVGTGQLLTWLGRLATGRGMALATCCAVAVLICAVLRRRDLARVPARLPLVIALFGMLTPGVTGHSGSSADHELAVLTVAMHTCGAALWVGGLGALLVLLAPHRVLLDPTLPRFSQLAGLCVTTVGLTGLVNALLRLGSPTELFGTPYGWLVLAKCACLAVLGTIGWCTRRRLRAGVTPVLRWAAVEVGVMAVTLGLAAVLSQTG